MKKYIAGIFMIILLLGVASCAKLTEDRESTIRIKAGIVMKSGDIKSVARQDFIITGNDPVLLWESAKSNNLKEIGLIEAELKSELNYDDKVRGIQNKISEINMQNSEINRRLKSNIALMMDQLVPLLETQKHFLMDNSVARFLTFIYLEPCKGISNNDSSLDDNERMIEKILEELTSEYNDPKPFVGIAAPTDIERDKVMVFQKDELKKIESIRAMLEKHKVEAQKISGKGNVLLKEISVLKKELSDAIEAKCKIYYENATKEYQLELRKTIKKIIKTNLGGEAEFTMKKGNYFIFGLAEVGTNKIVWNHPISIVSEDIYLELSNDNAYAIGDDALFAELKSAVINSRGMD
jgi:hypothetical protein